MFVSKLYYLYIYSNGAGIHSQGNSLSVRWKIPLIFPRNILVLLLQGNLFSFSLSNKAMNARMRKKGKKGIMGSFPHSHYNYYFAFETLQQYY